ncbi:MAG: DUF72 domain-containing protein [Ilumatobacteraceae bacterium]
MGQTVPLNARAFVGCSGWQYRDWRGVIYPERLAQRCWFEHYTTRFDTVELNATFYRLPEATTVERWAAAAPPGFVYALKLGAFGSHRMKLRDAASWLPNHLDRARRLGPSLGPTLVQLPPRWKRDVARLEDFFAAAPTDVRWAVELREQSWLHDDVYEVLARHDAAMCVHDLLDHVPWKLTASWAYVRFHGPEAMKTPYHGRYTGRRLWRHAERIQAWLDDGCDVYAYFNNDWYGNAVFDAEWLAERLGGYVVRDGGDG